MSGSPRRQGRAPGAATTANLDQRAAARPDVWRSIVLLPNPVPGVRRQDIDLSTRFLGQICAAPLLLAAETVAGQAGILAAMATTAARLGVPLVAGDTVALLDDPARLDDMSASLDAAGNPPILASIAGSALIRVVDAGAAGQEQLQATLDQFGAIGLVVRLDFSQPAALDAADPTNASRALVETAATLRLPLLVRADDGLPRWVARSLVDGGVAGLVVGGAAPRPAASPAAPSSFDGWGIPPYAAIRMLRGMSVPLISHERVVTGIDAAKAIALGADLVMPSVRASNGPGAGDELDRWLDHFLDDLRTTMYLTGTRNLAALKHAPFVATGETREWLEAAEMMWRADTGHH